MRTRRSASSSSDPVSSSPRKGREPGAHQSVLLHEVIASLSLQPDDVVLDATLGGAGHAHALVKELDARGTFIGIDADRAAIARAQDVLADAKPHVHLVEANFRHLDDTLSQLGVERISKALFDLGWSGYQLTAGRGFSFLTEEPLLMTYAETPVMGAVTAETIVNRWKEESIADVLFGWGEERYARKIAKAIVERRKVRPFKTSKDLADTIASVVRGGKLHPATRTFQALRIAANDELGALKAGLSAAWRRLAEGGRLAVISFHSIEDREVKYLMRTWEKEGVAKLLTKSPVVASREELSTNPRSRSAKLRVAEKIKHT